MESSFDLLSLMRPEDLLAPLLAQYRIMLLSFGLGPERWFAEMQQGHDVTRHHQKFVF